MSKLKNNRGNHPRFIMNLQLFGYGSDDMPIENGEDLFESAEETNEVDSEESSSTENESIEGAEEENSEETSEQQTETAAEQLFKIKYNGQEMELPQSEILTLAQKGMNYDHVKSERDSFANSKEFQALEQYAKANGMTRAEFADYLLAQQGEIEVQNEEQNITNKYGEQIPEELAREIAEIRINQRKEINERKAREQQLQTKQAEDAKLQAFLSEYPDIQPKDIPNEVWEKVNNGQDLLSAYRGYENKQLKSQLQAMKQNQTNKKKAIGSVTGNGNDKIEDDFLKGLFG